MSGAAHTQEPGEPRAQSALGLEPGWRGAQPRGISGHTSLRSLVSTWLGDFKFWRVRILPPFSSALSLATLTSTPPAQDPFSLAAVRRRPSLESCSGWQACGVLRKGSRAELLSTELDAKLRGGWAS